MAKISKLKKTNFTVVSNKITRDETLSWKARGIFLYIYSQDDNWDFYELEVSKHATDGRDSLRSGLIELENKGYLKRSRARSEKGQLSNSNWIISDEPMLENPTQVNPMQVDGTLRNTNKRNTKESNTNQKNIMSSSDEHDHIPYSEIIDYLNQKASTKYRHTTAKTKSLIKARWKEGNRVDDFKQVVNNKVTEWSGSDMARYLRPDTLFGTKFEGYLNQSNGNSAREQRHQEMKEVYGF